MIDKNVLRTHIKHATTEKEISEVLDEITAAIVKAKLEGEISILDEMVSVLTMRGNNVLQELRGDKSNKLRRDVVTVSTERRQP